MKLVAYLTLQLLTLKKKYKILKAAAARRRAANADLVIKLIVRVGKFLPVCGKNRFFPWKKPSRQK
jgi:hypothetical protein